jgi:polysaccharide export outer membrane protein
MNPIRHALLALLTAAPCACAHTTTAPAEPEASEYQIGREDVLEIAVWKDPALTTTAPVRPDGRISVPMLGDVDACGKTPRLLSAELSKKLGPYVKDPLVQVIVREVNSRKFAIVGEVAHPGVYPMRGHTSILQAVAQAGGITEFGARGGILIIRPATGSGDRNAEQRLRVNLNDVVDGSGGVPTLRPGDTVYVP